MRGWAVFDRLPLSPWQRVLLWPGGAFMDWLARSYPDIVIVYGIGFTMDSYVFWTAILSMVFWVTVFLTLSFLVRLAWQRLR